MNLNNLVRRVVGRLVYFNVSESQNVSTDSLKINQNKKTHCFKLSQKPERTCKDSAAF
jgi:hypothetical protein